MSGVTYRTITLEIADSVAVLTLDRPDKLNAIVGAMHAELQDALTATESDARALIITGAGRGFCAGQDLSERRFAESDRPNLGAGLDRAYNPLIRRLRALPMPVIAAVNGVAAGAGMSLALAADIVLAARSATFIQAFAKLGLVPDAGSSYWLPRLVGPEKAVAMIVSGNPINASAALEAGVVDAIAAGEDALCRREARDALGVHTLEAARLVRQPRYEGERVRVEDVACALSHDRHDHAVGKSEGLFELVERAVGGMVLRHVGAIARVLLQLEEAGHGHRHHDARGPQDRAAVSHHALEEARCGVRLRGRSVARSDSFGHVRSSVYETEDRPQRAAQQ